MKSEHKLIEGQSSSQPAPCEDPRPICYSTEERRPCLRTVLCASASHNDVMRMLMDVVEKTKLAR